MTEKLDDRATVISELHAYRDPVDMVVQKMVNPDGEETEAADAQTGVYQGITVEELTAKWQETVLGLQMKGITVTNAKNALEGALLIRCVQPKNSCRSIHLLLPGFCGVLVKYYFCYVLI